MCSRVLVLVGAVCTHVCLVAWLTPCAHSLAQVTKQQWADVMGRTLQLEQLPWFSLVNTVAVLDEANHVHYTKFLDRYRVIMAGDHKWQDDVVSEVSTRLFRACSDLSQAYKLFDLDDDGVIEYAVGKP